MLVFTIVAMEIESCDIPPVKFCFLVAEFLNPYCWYIFEQVYCPLQVGVLWVDVFIIPV